VKIWNVNKGAALVLILPFFILSAKGCSAPSVAEREVQKPLPELAWPAENPRIRFINSLSKPEHLGIKPSVISNFISFFSGRSEKIMIKPYGLKTDALGRLYVVDTALKTVHVYDMDRNEYDTLNPKEAPFSSPIDVAIDDQRGYIYVTDSELKVIKIFREEDRSYVGEIGKGVCKRPTGIAVNDMTSELLVVDTLQAKILRYQLDDRKFKASFGSPGKKAGRFHYPTSICVKDDGTILISDTLNFRIQIFSSAGEFLGMFGSEGDTPGYFTRPRGVAADHDGNIYVVDALFDNIQVFDATGRVLMAFGNHGTGYGEFWLPAGICIDKNDRIYISDCYNKRVQVYQYLENKGVQE